MENANVKTAPYAVAALILGISSLATGCLFVGLVLGIVGLVLANKGTTMVNLSPESYGGIGMLKAGKVMSLIGLILGAINTVVGLIMMAFTGGSILWIMDVLEDLM
ncbi:MAG: hypothetical protein MJZ49_08050 [Bacteroidales bacterium]|nr:hypothetical protein [Bacteroidales bacterium]